MYKLSIDGTPEYVEVLEPTDEALQAGAADHHPIDEVAHTSGGVGRRRGLDLRSGRLQANAAGVAAPAVDPQAREIESAARLLSPGPLQGRQQPRDALAPTRATVLQRPDAKVPALLARRPAKEKVMDTSLLRCMAAASLCSVLGCLSPAQAQAQTMLVQSAGSFATDAPLTPFSSPGGLWSFSFTLDSQPLLEEGVEAYRDGEFTTPQFASFEYRLNGELLPEASFVILYSAAWLGGMELIFGGIPVGTPYGYNALQFFGDAYYSGSELTPTIEAGGYTTFLEGGTGVQIAFEGRTYLQPATEVTISAVPTPPSLALMMAGLTALAVYRRSARHSMQR